MVLRAVKPEIITPKKPVFILSGDWGVGKSWLALDFPKPFYIDTEGGATQPEYVKKMQTSGAGYMGKEQGSQDFETVVEQVKELATAKHDYQTLVLDSFTKLYNLTAAEAEIDVGNKYAADKKEAQKPTRQLHRWIDKLDMTVILVCHSKAEWKNGAATGQTTFDGWNKQGFDLDLWLELQLNGKTRTITVRKTRLAGFVMGNSYPADYESFARQYGKEIIEKPAIPTVLATPVQVEKVKELVELFNISADDQLKALKKYDAEKYEELSNDQIVKIIDGLNSKLTKGAK